MADQLDCTVTNKTIDADPDIVGNGVLAAFFVTAAFTTIAIIVGYFSHSLDEAVLTDLDEQIITWAQGRWKALKHRTQAIGRALRRRKKSSRKKIDKSIFQLPSNREARKDALNQFILSLSDQQLVTGLSILVAGVSNQRTLTGYEFGVILSLAWFSTTTHLATLDALRKLLSSQGIIRTLRVAGMLCVSILLMYTLGVVFSLGNKTLPVQCLFNTGNTPSSPNITSGGNITALLNDTSSMNTTNSMTITASGNATYIDELEDSVESLVSSIAGGLSDIVILSSTIIWQYSTRIHGLYYEIPLLERIFSFRSFRSFRSNREAVGLRMAKARAKKLLRIRDTTNGLRYILEAWYEYESSFIAAIPSMTYNFTFGVCLVASYRWLTLPLTSDDSVMNFGQIMPLLLLLLPFLTAGQTIHDYRSKGAETLRRSVSTKSRHSYTSSTEVWNDKSKLFRRDPLIYLSQGIGGIDQDLVVAGEEYDHHLVEILKYFFQRARTISDLETKRSSKEDALLNILKLKREIWQEYNSIKTVEASLHIGPPLTLFAVEMILAIATGVVFNIGPSSAIADMALRFSLSALNVGVSLLGPLTELFCDMLNRRRTDMLSRRRTADEDSGDALGDTRPSTSRTDPLEVLPRSLHLPVNTGTWNQVSDSPRSRPGTPLPSYDEEMDVSLASPAYNQIFLNETSGQDS